MFNINNNINMQHITMFIILASMILVSFIGLNYLADQRAEFYQKLDNCIIDTAYEQGFNGGLQDSYKLFAEYCAKKI